MSRQPQLIKGVESGSVGGNTVFKALSVTVTIDDLGAKWKITRELQKITQKASRSK